MLQYCPVVVVLVLRIGASYYKELDLLLVEKGSIKLSPQQRQQVYHRVWPEGFMTWLLRLLTDYNGPEPVPPTLHHEVERDRISLSSLKHKPGSATQIAAYMSKGNESMV